MDKRLVEPREHGTVKEVMVDRLHITVLSKIQHVSILVMEPINRHIGLESQKRLIISYALQSNLILKTIILIRLFGYNQVLVHVRGKKLTGNGEFLIQLMDEKDLALVVRIHLPIKQVIYQQSQNIVLLLVNILQDFETKVWKIIVPKYIVKKVVHH